MATIPFDQLETLDPHLRVRVTRVLITEGTVESIQRHFATPGSYIKADEIGVRKSNVTEISRVVEVLD